MINFFNVITCPFSETISCNKPDLNILFNNEDIVIFVKSDLDLSSRLMGGDSHNLLHIIYQDLSADSESEKILSIGKLMAELSSF
jgi:hypothetical protein